MMCTYISFRIKIKVLQKHKDKLFTLEHGLAYLQNIPIQLIFLCLLINSFSCSGIHRLITHLKYCRITNKYDKIHTHNTTLTVIKTYKNFPKIFGLKNRSISTRLLLSYFTSNHSKSGNAEDQAESAAGPAGS